jgi:hypothetical protein
MPQRPDGALEHRGVGEVEVVAARRSSRPPSRACATPVSVSGTSVQPVKRFSRFQVDSPWRMRTSLCMENAAMEAHRGENCMIRAPRHPPAFPHREVPPRELVSLILSPPSCRAAAAVAEVKGGAGGSVVDTDEAMRLINREKACWWTCASRPSTPPAMPRGAQRAAGAARRVQGPAVQQGRCRWC